MKIVNLLSTALLAALLVLGSVYLIWAADAPERWQTEMAHVGDLPAWLGATGGIGLIVLVVIVGLTGLPKARRKRRLLSFDNEGGTVSISTDAICDYIAKLAEEFPSVVKLVPEVVTTRNAIDIIIGVRVKAGPQIHEVCELLQQRARESLTNGLGISQVRRIEVSVNDIASEHRPK